MAYQAQCITSANLLIGVFSIKMFFWCDLYKQIVGHNVGMSPFSSNLFNFIEFQHFGMYSC